MKFSDAMLKGYMKVGGKQFTEGGSSVVGSARYFPKGDDPARPSCVCAVGAANLGFGRAANKDGDCEGASFHRHWGVDVADLSDEGMPWEHIYGMAVAAGL